MSKKDHNLTTQIKEETKETKEEKEPDADEVKRYEIIAVSDYQFIFP